MFDKISYLYIIALRTKLYKYMKKLTVLEATTSASGSCVYCTKTEAERRFAELGVKGQTALCYIKDGKGETFVLWVNDDGKNVRFLPLFIDDMRLDNLHYADIIPLRTNAFLFHKRGKDCGISYFVLINEHETVVRQVKIFLDQYLVENYCSTRGINPTGIYICKMQTIKDNEYLTTCWSIEYEDPNNLDEDGEPEQYGMLLAIDLADSDILFNIGIANVNSIYLHEGDTFKVQGVLYRVMKDEFGKYFITKDLFSPKEEPTPEEKQEKPEAPEKDDEADEPACLIIPFHPH